MCMWAEGDVDSRANALVAQTVSVDCIGSGVGNTDQLSVKDSGKGDSDFNDSDSDMSGDLCKRNFTTFQPRSGESPARLLPFLLTTFVNRII